MTYPNEADEKTQGLHAPEIADIERCQRCLGEHVFAKRERRPGAIGLERLLGMFAGAGKHLFTPFDQLFSISLTFFGARPKALHHLALEPLDTERIERGIDTLWTAYRVRGDVAAAEVEGGLILRLDVKEMALDFAPRFVGNERVSTEKLLDWAGLEVDSELYLFQAESVARRIEKEYFKFSAAHFLIFPDGSAERLHGHNYRVFVDIDAALSEHGLVIDFKTVKPVVRELVDDQKG